MLAIKRALYRFVLSPARWLYWFVFKPTTYGAMMLVVDEAAGRILLVRHAYGKRHIWTIPGGGYRPSQETAEDAAIREAWEEVGVRLADIVCLGETEGLRVAKRDTRQVFCGVLQSQEAVRTAEIEEQRWVTWDQARTLPLSKVATFALDQYQAGSERS